MTQNKNLTISMQYRYNIELTIYNFSEIQYSIV